jgi:hypothetical protein
MKYRVIFLLALLLSALGYNALNPLMSRTPSEFHLVKTDRQGQALPIWSGPWQCVFDQKTNLMWETKQDDESIHDGYWTYSWYQQGLGVANKGDCYFEDKRCDVADLIRRANRAKTCGIATWRLPTTQELHSLVTNQTRPGEPTINKDFFPHTKKGDYWSAEAGQTLQGIFSHLGEGALAVNFGAGNTVTLPYRNAAFVRLVSIAKPTL